MEDDTRDLLSFQNQKRVEDLSQKVSLLKEYAVDIESETKRHNRLLNDVDDDFESNFVFFKRTRNRLNRLLISNRSPKSTCYFSLAVCLVLFFVYFLISIKMK